MIISIKYQAPNVNLRSQILLMRNNELFCIRKADRSLLEINPSYY